MGTCPSFSPSICGILLCIFKNQYRQQPQKHQTPAASPLHPEVLNHDRDASRQCFLVVFFFWGGAISCPSLRTTPLNTQNLLLSSQQGRVDYYRLRFRFGVIVLLKCKNLQGLFLLFLFPFFMYSFVF